MICTNDARLIASIAVKFSPLFKSDDQSHFAKPQKQQLLAQANIFPCNLRLICKRIKLFLRTITSKLKTYNIYTKFNEQEKKLFSYKK
ncbi:hypothetical protein T05_14474 [Trichinella murrelli]|uniref:Uncharacterized protein n=1 Tax=Trichinella murrelli TaxID=144512 RepID=A0A0V0U7R1_9BILA|nr:hypothetical protein T05_14474 [Trichinella murrelli]